MGKRKVDTLVEFEINARGLLDAFRVVNEFTEEAMFTFDSDGLWLQMLDPSHVAMIEWMLPRDCMEVYGFAGRNGKPFEVGVNVATVLRRFPKIRSVDDTVKVTITEWRERDDEKKLIRRGEWHYLYRNRRFTVSSLYLETDKLPRLRVSWRDYVSLTCRGFKSALEDFKKFGTDVVEMVLNDDEFIMKADSYVEPYTGELVNLTIRWDRTNNELLEIDCSKTRTGKYHLGWLISISKIDKLANTIRLSLAGTVNNPKPLKVTADTWVMGVFNFYIAPYVD